ncbi:QacE family quaternary ammonium compound efflux SMR transporter [Helicobacter didelphidarum]|uniref:Guanidinium exporter n=1 Tax=Helicobacter didelphidarum TaxID=2040648 RepID=A0A3D8IMD7_9HELI|nr:multidrug efflux SMR transporter [Helicobacter didelphidarum]RDU66398.1 QacE family quaternary ammonium compound efflux SMR transporter [Helicobacter didelphidarum]
MRWIFFIFAGWMEIVGVVAVKKFAETNSKIYLLGIIVQFALSFWLLSLAMRGISMGVAYAVWTGIGAAGGVLVGIVLFKESKNASKLFFVSLILVSSIGLKLIS